MHSHTWPLCTGSVQLGIEKDPNRTSLSTFWLSLPCLLSHCTAGGSVISTNTAGHSSFYSPVSWMTERFHKPQTRPRSTWWRSHYMIISYLSHREVEVMVLLLKKEAKHTTGVGVTSLDFFTDIWRHFRPKPAVRPSSGSRLLVVFVCTKRNILNNVGLVSESRTR